MDYYDGYDLRVRTNSLIEYNVKLYVSTKRSIEYSELKRIRHNYDADSKTISVGLDLSSAKKIGDIYVYDKEIFKNIFGSILK